MIPKEQLIIDHYYKGEGRNANVGLWDGKVFLTIGYKFRYETLYHEAHWDDPGCFKPLEEII